MELDTLLPRGIEIVDALDAAHGSVTRQVHERHVKHYFPREYKEGSQIQ